MKKYTLLIFAGLMIFTGCQQQMENDRELSIRVSDNQRYFTDQDDNPFFWLGDTGWLLFSKCSREDAEKYLANRAEKGFNVIQVMILHSLEACNVYGDSALVNRSVGSPLETEGNLFSDPVQYDYWDHVDYIVGLAAENDIFMALVPVWGTNVRSGNVSRQEAGTYAEWLANRYKDRPNIVWLIGGDTFGYDSTATWTIMGNILDETDPNHLITFHPYGRMQSSMWFHAESWLDFNMFQSGHRRYDQDDTELNYGEDNWRYAKDDWSKDPVKPTLDGEPSYEGIPQGLHDPTQPYWTDNDLRRYAYWSVFAGSCGFTYGHSAIMQFHRPGDTIKAYGVREYWQDAMDAPGADQMKYLAKLMLSRPYFERIPDQTIVGETQGERYDYQAATRGKDYAFVYTWNGRDIQVNMGKISGEMVKASWFDPRTGLSSEIGEFKNKGTKDEIAPGE